MTWAIFRKISDTDPWVYLGTEEDLPALLEVGTYVLLNLDTSELVTENVSVPQAAGREIKAKIDEVREALALPPLGVADLKRVREIVTT